MQPTTKKDNLNGFYPLQTVSYLSIDLYEKYCTTYSDADHANLWQAVFNGCDLFRSLAVKVGAHLGYLYNEKDDEGTMRYLEMMKKDAFAVKVLVRFY